MTEPVDFQSRVVEVAGNLTGKYPEFEEFLNSSVRDDVLRVANQVRARIATNGSLRSLLHKGLPAMLLGAVAMDYPALCQHMAGTCILAKKLAGEIGMAEDVKRVIGDGAMLHDIGKMDPAIRTLVDFPGQLNQAEKDIVAWHPELGARIAECFDLDGQVVAIIRDHHKRPDGNGYVAQNSSDLEIQAAIVELADTLDAMSKGRPGKMRLSYDEIIGGVRKSRGTHFHTEVADAFLRDPGKILGIDRAGRMAV